eukprot:5043412-Alexandrium_andersonii.AAC.1
MGSKSLSRALVWLGSCLGMLLQWPDTPMWSPDPQAEVRLLGPKPRPRRPREKRAFRCGVLE